MNILFKEILLVYVCLVFIVGVVATIDMLEEPWDEDTRWWMIPRAFGFILIAPLFFIYMIVQTMVENALIKRRKRRAK